MKISFHGADQGVTGSCHLIECAGKRILIGENFSEEIPGIQTFVRSAICTIGGFSAYADQVELFAWHSKTANPKTTFLVHGEEKSMKTFANKLSGTQVKMPKLGEEYAL